MIDTIKQLSLTLLLALALSACGFHLRGSQQSTEVDIAGLFLRSTAADRVGAAVKSQLENAGTALSPSLAKAEYILSLSREAIRRSVLSVSANTGKVDEYQLELSVNMSIAKPGQDELVAAETIRVARGYAFDEDAILGKAAEEKLLEDELLRQAAAQIIRRLRAAIR